MGFIKAIGAFFSAIGSVFGFLRSRSEANNAPDVKAAKKAQDEIDAQNKADKAVAARDTDATRGGLAE